MRLRNTKLNTICWVGCVLSNSKQFWRKENRPYLTLICAMKIPEQKRQKSKWFPPKSIMTAKNLISSNFECIHATVIILTSSNRCLGRGIRWNNYLIDLTTKITKWLPPKSIMATQEKLNSSNFDIHATVIILTSSHRFLGSTNTMEQLFHRLNHTKK